MNIFLLLLIIIVLGVLAGLTTYYQTTYKNLSESYGDKLNQLNQLNYNLSLQKAQLNSVNEELKLKTSVKEKFDVLYTNISEYNDELNSDLVDTRKELVSTLGRLKETGAELDSRNSELATVKAALKTQQGYSAELELQISALRSQNCNLHQRLNESC